MIKKILCGLIAVIGAMTFNSCQKEVDPSILETNNPPITGDFKAKIDGVQWVANSAAGASRMSGFISLVGRSTDKKYVSIHLVDSGVHNYTLNDVTLNVASYIDSNLTNTFNFSTNQGVGPGDAGGVVNVTSIDAVNKKISGTFSFRVFR